MQCRRLPLLDVGEMKSEFRQAERLPVVLEVHCSFSAVELYSTSLSGSSTDLDGSPHLRQLSSISVCHLSNAPAATADHGFSTASPLRLHLVGEMALDLHDSLSDPSMAPTPAASYRRYGRGPTSP